MQYMNSYKNIREYETHNRIVFGSEKIVSANESAFMLLPLVKEESTKEATLVVLIIRFGK